MAESLVETGELEETQTLAMKILGIRLPKRVLILKKPRIGGIGKITRVRLL